MCYQSSCTQCIIGRKDILLDSAKSKAPLTRTSVVNRSPIVRCRVLAILSGSCLQWRCACRWPAMVGCLLVGIGEFDHVAIVVGPAQKGDSGR